MSLLHLECFSYLATIDEKYTVSNATDVTVDGASRTGTYCVKVKKDDWLEFPITASDTGVLGFALYCYTPTNSPKVLVDFRRSGSSNMTLVFLTSGIMELRRGSTILATSIIPFIREVFQYIEVKWNCVNSISANSFQVRLDGTIILDLDATTDCQESGTSGVDVLRLWGPGTTVYYDDVYVLNLSGAQCNDYLGNIIIETLYPNGNGNTNDFTGSDADSTDNYLHVDEAQHDSDTSYVESSTISHIDLYAFGNMVGTPDTIHCVALVCPSRKDDGGARDGRLLTRVNITNYEGASFSPTTSFVHEVQIWELNPDDSAAWAITDIDGAEFGIKVQV